LIGFVVPTLVVGYGIVIPQSCIAGVNELSIGFGTTILGAAMTYVAGQHAAIAKGVCSKPPLRVRLTRAINRQAASPSGLFGRLLALIWPKEHGRLNVEVLDQLDLRPGQRVLEIGSGTGHALREAALRSAGGYVLGLDISELMLRRARALNRNSIARGEVDLRLGDIATLPLGEETFDRIFSVHCIYFWHDVDAVLAKLSHALSPDGKLVLAFRPESDDIPARFRDATYRFPRVEQVQAVLERLGLEIERTTMSGVSPAVVLLTAMRRQSADVCQTSSGLAWEPARPSPAEHD
jgi:SAM-dependent methyltransferase